MFDPRSFVHLSVRSNFSLKDGAFFPEELALRAAELQMEAVALTDRDGLYGAARFVDACSKVGVRPILGATLTIRGGCAPWAAGGAPRGLPPRSNPRSAPPAAPRSDASLVVLAQDATGYANLCRLVTDAHMAGERGDPALAAEQVLPRAGGLLCLVGPRSAVGRLAIAGRHDAALAAIRPFREAFGERLFVEVEHRVEERSNQEVRRLLRLADDAGVRAVATNGVRYLGPEDAFLADALECMREIVPVAPHHLTRSNAEGYLKPADAMRLLFAERPEVCDATVEIAESCTFDLGLGRVHFPDFPTPAGRSASSVLAERCMRGLERRGVERTREVRDRLDHELAMIHRLGYSPFFLTVAEIVDDVRAMGIRSACRGSAAGSFVCYLTGISDVDPIRHGLVFERFLNPLRDELPDIDIDVESARREDVYDMVLSRHGDDRCACVCMVETYRARAAIREVGKALALPDTEVDAVAKALPHIGAHHIREAIETLPELRDSNLGRGQLESLIRVAERLNGFPRHLALHPSAISLASHDLVERVPLERSFQGYRMLQADKDDVELLGYLKLDVLGIRMLSSMRHCLDEVARTEGVKVDLDEIPLDDGPTFDLIRSSDTIGCFQIESPGQRELLQKLQPTRWADLIVDISLFRPGPVKSDMVSPYLRRRVGMELPSYVHDDLRPALQETFGVIVYHEQVMRTFALMAGYDLAEADRIRRHLDDDREVDAIERDFLERVRARGLPDAEAERVWKELRAFASFGFCKAHAAAFAVPTYQSSYLKAHWPAHFLAGVLTHDPGMYPRRLILEDARRRGIPILPLDVNRSEREYVVEEVVDPAMVARDGAVSVTGPSRSRNGKGSTCEMDTSGAVPVAPRVPPATERPWLTNDRDHVTMRHAAHVSAAVVPHADAGSVREAEALEGGGGPAKHAYGAQPDRTDGDPVTCGSGGVPVLETASAVPPATTPPTTHAIRLGLQDVHGISEAEIASIVEARAEGAFLSVRDFLRRTRVSRPVVERLAHAGGFDALPDRARSRRDRLYAAMVTDPERVGEQLALPLYEEVGPGLREYTEAERVRAELEVVEMDVSRHLVTFYEPVLEALGVTRSKDLWRLRANQSVVVAGVKVSSQTPAVRSGERIIFLTLDDATGPVEVTVFPNVQDRCAKTVFHGFLLAVRGTLRRTGIRGVSVVAQEVLDLAELGKRWRGTSAASGAGRPPVKVWHASGGSAGW